MSEVRWRPQFHTQFPDRSKVGRLWLDLSLLVWETQMLTTDSVGEGGREGGEEVKGEG